MVTSVCEQNVVESSPPAMLLFSWRTPSIHSPFLFNPAGSWGLELVPAVFGWEAGLHPGQVLPAEELKFTVMIEMNNVILRKKWRSLSAVYLSLNRRNRTPLMMPDAFSYSRCTLLIQSAYSELTEDLNAVLGEWCSHWLWNHCRSADNCSTPNDHWGRTQKASLSPLNTMLKCLNFYEKLNV